MVIDTDKDYKVEYMINQRFKPTLWEIHEWASVVHGIFMKDLENEPDIKKFTMEIIGRIWMCWYIGWHNCDFDNKVLLWELKNKWSAMPKEYITSAKIFDTMKASTDLCKIPNPRWWYKRPKLQEFGENSEWFRSSSTDDKWARYHLSQKPKSRG
jgi:hypothetical protein